jgi:hypothetical protein
MTIQIPRPDRRLPGTQQFDPASNSSGKNFTPKSPVFPEKNYKNRPVPGI